MHEYPESFKAMDLVGEHRLRALHASWAWEKRARAPDAITRGASRLERFLEVLMTGIIFYPNQCHMIDLIPIATCICCIAGACA